jgi:intein/homing endonuclease
MKSFDVVAALAIVLSTLPGIQIRADGPVGKDVGPDGKDPGKPVVAEKPEGADRALPPRSPRGDEVALPPRSPRGDEVALPPRSPRGDGEARPKAPKPAEEVTRSERWKAFKAHVEKLGKKELLPEEAPGSKPPATDGMQGVLFRMYPDLAAIDDFLSREPPDTTRARARLEKISGTEDPFLADYARLYRARCDLVEKKYPESIAGFEAVVESSRNLAGAVAHKGLADCHRAQGETTLEVLELRFALLQMYVEDAAERAQVEARLAEIRKDHKGPLADSEKRMGDLSKSLGGSKEDAEESAKEQKKVEETLIKTAKLLEAVSKDQSKVEEILIKTAKLLEEQARLCPECGGT